MNHPLGSQATVVEAGQLEAFIYGGRGRKGTRGLEIRL